MPFKIYLRLLLFLSTAWVIGVVPVISATLSSQTVFSPYNSSTPLLPFLDYYLDESETWEIEEAANPQNADAFQPLVLNQLPQKEGIFWLRFILAPQPSGTKPATYFLDLGSSIPEKPILYDLQKNELSGTQEWRETFPVQRNLLLLPEANTEQLVCYIRISGVPGLWFNPTVLTPQNVANNWSSLSRTGAILCLGVVMLLCLLRCLSENGQWRFWTALFVGTSLLQALLGMPKILPAFSFTNFLAIVTPGIALMFIPHIGRHLMQTPKLSRALDIQLLLFSLAGGALALLPLFQGFIWLERWLDLWPAGMILFAPTVIAAAIMGLPGSKRFLFSCLFAPLCVAVAIFGLDFGFSPNFLASLPLWGIAICALVIAATRAPNATIYKEKNRKNEQKIVSPGLNDNESIINLEAPISQENEKSGNNISFHPLDDENLRILIDPPALENQDANTQFSGNQVQTIADEPIRARELAIRGCVDEILRSTASLEQNSLPATARQSADKIIATSQALAKIVGDTANKWQADPEKSPEIFNLQRVMRSAHDNTAPIAENKGLALSWFIPPYLEQFYKGDGESLEELLILLLESSIRGTVKGAVHLSAKKVPDSYEPGHILFSISDTGLGGPPLLRSSVALAKAWEFATKNNGYLNVESGPHGINITFSAHLTPCEEAGDESENLTHIILYGQNSDKNEELLKNIQDLPLRITTSTSFNEVLVRQRMDAACMLIVNGQFDTEEIEEILEEFKHLAHTAGYSSCSILAITEDDSLWSQLKTFGFTHAMIAPVTPAILQDTIKELTLQAKLSKNNNEESTQTNLIDLVDAFYGHANNFEQVTSVPNDSGFTEKSDNDSKNDSVNDEHKDDKKVEKENESLSMIGEQSIPLSDNMDFPDWLADENSAENNQDQKDRNNNGLNETTDNEVTHDNIPLVPDLLGEPVTIADAQTTKEENKSSQIAPEINKTVTFDEESVKVKGKSESGIESDIDESATITDNNSKENIINNELQKSEKAQDAKQENEPEVENKPPKLNDENPSVVKPYKAGADPLIVSLVEKLEEAMNQAVWAFEHDSPDYVAESTARLAQLAESFSLRHLTRMAQCVERAAKASDMEALKVLLPELQNAVERNRIVLTQQK